MGYTLQALIGDASCAKTSAPSGAPIVSLPQAMALVPFTDTVREAHGISFLPLTDEGEDDVPTIVGTFAIRARKIAYVEAEYFGGEGTQAAAVWEEGRLIFGPVVADDAINQALRVLGVLKKDSRDEFDALGLGQHRNTDDWI